LADDEIDKQGEPEPAIHPAPQSGRRLRLWWLLPLAIVVEFGIYGSRGHIEACVGKAGAHDFELVGQERTNANRWRFPRCEERTNLGLRSGYELKTREAVSVACRGATLLKHQGEGSDCVAGANGWQHRIGTSQCPPWHRHFWEHMLWFLG
jgi:hypothetical protein